MPDPRLQIVECSTCRKSIVWATRPDGKTRVPLDAKGLVFVVGQNSQGQLVAKTVKEFLANVHEITLNNGRKIGPDQIVAMLVTHYATCPQAGEHSRK